MADWWNGYPWRMIQTNMREIDMLDIDAGRFVADLVGFKATVVLVNSAGIIASYPTKLPYQFQSPYLKGDSLAEIISACHKANIRFLARTDFSKIRRQIYEVHPDWAYRTANGEIVDYNGDVHACINGDYQQIYALDIIKELITTHEIDGIFFNMGGYKTTDYSGNYYGICHCESCRKSFNAMFGLALPRAEEMSDPVYRKYQVFKERTAQTLHSRISELIRTHRPDMCVDKDFQNRRGFIRQECNTAIERPLPHWQYSGSSNTKWAVSTYPEMVSSNTTVDFIDYPYRHVAVSPHQQKLRLTQSLANGGAIDFYLMGRLDNHEDRSGFEGVREIFGYHAANEKAYTGNVSKAEIALFDNSKGSSPESQGWFRFLVENHFLFDMPQIDGSLNSSWERYRVIILPDLQPLSDALAAKLDAFAAGGGTVVATGRTGFCDENFEPRELPVLKCLGIEQIEFIQEKTRSTYLKLDNKDGFPRFSDTDLLYLDGPYVYAVYAAGTETRFKMIPPHNFGPPERCYYEVVADRPGFTIHPFQKGKAIYIPWLPGVLFHRQGYTNTSNFAADLIEHIAGITPVGGILSPMVEVTLFGREGSMDGTAGDGSAALLHLVNTSGHFGTTFYPPVTMHGLTVELPWPVAPTAVTSLVTGEGLAYSFSADTLTITVPELELFDAIRIT